MATFLFNTYFLQVYLKEGAIAPLSRAPVHVNSSSPWQKTQSDVRPHHMAYHGTRIPIKGVFRHRGTYFLSEKQMQPKNLNIYFNETSTFIIRQDTADNSEQLNLVEVLSCVI